MGTDIDVGVLLSGGIGDRASNPTVAARSGRTSDIGNGNGNGSGKVERVVAIGARRPAAVGSARPVFPVSAASGAAIKGDGVRNGGVATVGDKSARAATGGESTRGNQRPTPIKAKPMTLSANARQPNVKRFGNPRVWLCNVSRAAWRTMAVLTRCAFWL